MNHIHTACFFALFLALAPAGEAQTARTATYDLQVQVMDDAGKPMVGTQVRVSGLKPGQGPLTLKTDTAGRTRVLRAPSQAQLSISPETEHPLTSSSVAVRADRNKGVLLTMVKPAATTAPAARTRRVTWRMKEIAIVRGTGSRSGGLLGGLEPRPGGSGTDSTGGRKVTDFWRRRGEKKPGDTKPTDAAGDPTPGRKVTDFWGTRPDVPGVKPEPKPGEAAGDPTPGRKVTDFWGRRPDAPASDLELERARRRRLRERERRQPDGRPSPGPSTRPTVPPPTPVDLDRRFPDRKGKDKQPRPESFGPATREDSLLARKLAFSRPLRRGSLAQLGSIRVGTERNGTATLASIAARTFRKQASLRVEAGLAQRRGFLWGDPHVQDEVIELEHEFLLQQKTLIVIARPDELLRSAGADSEIGRFLSGRGGRRLALPGSPPAAKAPGQPTQEDMRLGLAQFRAKELPRLDPGHPLALAAAQGDAALLQAVLAGQGGLEITETLSVPKRALIERQGVFQHPGLRNGALDLSASSPWSAGASRLGDAIGGRPVRAEMPVATFDLFDAQSLPDLVAIRPAGGDAWLSVDARRSLLTTRGGQPAAQETFHVAPAGVGCVALRAAASGRFVTTDGGGRLVLGADDGPADVRSFRLLRSHAHRGEAYVLLSRATGRFVHMARGGGGLFASAERLQDATAFSFAAASWAPRLEGVVSGAGVPGGTRVQMRHAGPAHHVANPFTDRNGAFQYVPSFGDRVTVAPQHDDFVFTPPARVVRMDRLHSGLDFRAEPARMFEGARPFVAEFVLGKTMGDAWEWEQRWDYPSGFFRITLGASYEAGLRVPIEVTGSVSPGGARFRRKVEAVPFEVELGARTRNADAGFYGRTGMPRGHVADGQETVFKLGFHFGMKFRALWTDIVHIRPTQVGIDLGQQGTPEFAGHGGFGRFVIPPDLTRTGFNWGALWGSAAIGADVEGRNSAIFLDVQPLPDGHVETLEFCNRDTVTLDAMMPERPLQPGESRYGVRISNPRYRTEMSICPGLEVDVGVGVSGFSRSFGTGWIPLRAFAVDLGEPVFSAHDGTEASATIQEARRSLTR